MLLIYYRVKELKDMKHSTCNNRKVEKRLTSTAVTTSFRSPRRIGLVSPIILTVIVSFLTLFSSKVEGKAGLDFWKEKDSTSEYSDTFDFDDHDNERMDL